MSSEGFSDSKRIELIGKRLFSETKAEIIGILKNHGYSDENAEKTAESVLMSYIETGSVDEAIKTIPQSSNGDFPQIIDEVRRVLEKIEREAEEDREFTLSKILEELSSGEGKLFTRIDYFEGYCEERSPDPQKCWRKLSIENRIPLLFKLWKEKIEDKVKIVRVITKPSNPPELSLAIKGVLYDPEHIIDNFLTYALGGFGQNIRYAFVHHLNGKAEKTIPFEKIQPLRYLPLKSRVIDLETLEAKRYEDIDAYFRWTHDYDIDYRLFEKLMKGEAGEEVFQSYNFYSRLLRRFYEGEEYERIKDILGSILAPYSLKLFAIVKGDPNTGKDTLVDLINEALGDSVDHSTLEDLTGNYTFKNEPLLGKRVIIVSEKPEHIIKDAEALKRLVGGTTLKAHRKNRPAVEIRNNIFKLIVFANEIPTLPRIEDAILDRIMVVEASNPLKEEEKDPTFKELLRREREAFLLFMLYCYKQLKDRGFILRKQDKETLAQMLLESYYKDVESFAEEEIELDPLLRIERGEAYKLYADWCSKKGKKPMGRNSFYEKFRQLLVKKYAERGSFIEKVEIMGSSKKRYFVCGRKGEKAEIRLSDFTDKGSGGAEGSGSSESGGKDAEEKPKGREEERGEDSEDPWAEEWRKKEEQAIRYELSRFE